MGEQKQKKKSDGENNKDAGKKEETPTSTTVVFKVDMHCDGCASKIVRCLRSFQGVESVKAESEVGKLTITGKVDPSKVREKLGQKTKKKVDLISPHPNKDNANNTNNTNKPDNNKKPKEKQAPVTTVVLKVALHCQGCIERIRKTVFKTKGVHEVAIDKEKETVTVKGTMDAKALVGNLMRRLKRKVEVLPPKKDNKDADKEKEGAPADKGGSGAAKKKKKGGGGGGGGGGDSGESGGDGEGKVKQNQMESPAPAFMPYGGYSYGYDYGYNYGPLCMYQVHAPQIFSDENPNACSVM